MFFKQEHVEVILTGDKTQTRRPVKADKNGKIVQRYKVGHIYQARLNYSDDPFAYIRVTGVRQERLADMSEADCILEGYDGKAGYREVYTRIYGKFDENEPQWVIDFKLADDVQYWEHRLNGKLRDKLAR